MKLVTFSRNGEIGIAILKDEFLYNLTDLDDRFPTDMTAFLAGEEKLWKLALGYNDKIVKGELSGMPVRELKRVQIMAPVPNPTSMRDGYAFRQHVATARRNRGVEMIPEFDQYPIFYFTNHNAVYGPGPIEFMPDHFEKLDFELEVAIVVGKGGKNIPAAQADDHIAGYMIMNDLSARRLQMEEMKLNLGPAKGKDFGTVIGPWLVSKDELAPYLKETKPGHVGEMYDLEMTCRVNGETVSQGNMGDMDWTFAEIVERASYGTDVYPGDVIGSGTVGTGCFLELNGSARLENPKHKDQWLKEGDVVEMDVTGLGTLSNTILKAPSDHSILALKKEMANQ